MGLIEQIRAHKVAITEAFGLDLDKTSENISADHTEVIFSVRDPNIQYPGAVIGYECNSAFVTVKVPADLWTWEQREAAEAYIGLFPSHEDFPKEVRDLWGR